MSDDTLTAADLAALDEMRDEAPPAPAADTPPLAAPQLVEPTEGGAAEPAEQQPAAPRMVRLEALHEERERRKEAERRAQIVEERTNLILQRLNPQPAPQPQQQPATPTIPLLADDPLNHLVGRLEQANTQIAGLTQAQQQQAQQQQLAQVVQHVQANATAAEAEFRRKSPDYDAAVNHLMAQRSAQLEFAGFTDPAQRQAIMQQEALGIAARAMQAGRNPAEMIYGLAKLSGYAPAAAAAPAGNGAAAPAGDGTERMQRIEAGQQQARSVGQMRGAAPPSKTADRLANMSDAEFLKAMQDPEWKSLLG